MLQLRDYPNRGFKSKGLPTHHAIPECSVGYLAALVVAAESIVAAAATIEESGFTGTLGIKTASSASPRKLFARATRT